MPFHIHIFMYLSSGGMYSQCFSFSPSQAELSPTYLSAWCTHCWVSGRMLRSRLAQHCCRCSSSSAEAAWLHDRSVLPLFVVVDLGEQRCIQGEFSCWGVFSPETENVNPDCHMSLKVEVVVKGWKCGIYFAHSGNENLVVNLLMMTYGKQRYKQMWEYW